MRSLNRVRFVSIGAAFAVCLVAATMALAHSGAQGIVKQRMDSMDAMGKAMKTVGEMLKGTAQFDATAIVEAMRSVSVHADEIPGMFPEGSLSDPSEAREEIWSNWDRFTTLAEGLSTTAARLADIAKDGDRKAVAGAFNAVGKTCSGCHEGFRLKK